MELSDLRIFRTVVDAGGITAAAERLHRVPSNVTTRIKNLEERLGVALFVREHRRMQLSPAGRTLLDHADRLLKLADELPALLHETRPRGTLRLGAMESTAAARLPAPLCEFHRRHPDVAIELAIGDPHSLVLQVVAGELDAALVAEPASDPALETRAVYKEELVIVAPGGHPPIGTAKDLAKRTMLAFHHGCPHRKRFEDWFARAGVAPERVVEVASYHAILGCVVAGMGAALMPRSVLDTYTERARLSVHGLSAKFGGSRTLLVWRRDSPQANVAALAGILKPQ